ncbi:hypothetical protein FA95DRAFT_123791 [Auriscalpium vulgare]|uniref:Uncharacterized protein n=1 Tax=Auriscalpium vulgare TaxID=40419 RepID=A0ACB8RPD1_9AGAM|nr:hypothetical protein FA95DRAFT_123791 [Auriscalpium vulgare]
MQTQVPLEVQLMVVEWVYRSSQHGTIDYPTLRACALVCRSWTPVAQRLLFRRVPVPKPYAEVYDIPKITIDRLLRTLRAAPYLAAHVRSLICNSAAESNADAEQDSDFGDGDVAVLALCTDVASIIFLESVSPALVSHLPTLSVRPVFIYVFGETSLVNRVIDIWPSVRVLDVDGWHAGSISLHVPSAIQALSCYTPVLTWNYWSGSGPAPPVPSLHDLHLRLIDSRLKADMDGVPSSVLAQF